MTLRFKIYDAVGGLTLLGHFVLIRVNDSKYWSGADWVDGLPVLTATRVGDHWEYEFTGSEAGKLYRLGYVFGAVSYYPSLGYFIHGDSAGLSSAGRGRGMAGGLSQ